MRFKCFLILLIVAACNKSIRHSDMIVIGHAGSGLSTPKAVYAPNSKESVEYALGQYGVNGVEIDVQMTADGMLMLFHDETLDKESNMTGCISDYTYSALQGAHFKTVNKEKIIKLDELNPAYLENKSIYLDIRQLNACKDNILINKQLYLDALASSISKFPESTEVYGFVRDHSWVPDLENLGVKMYLQDESYNDFTKNILLYPHAQGLLIRNANITKSEVEKIQKTGKKVILFEIRSPKSTKEAFRKGCDGILTDDLLSALALKN